MRATVTALMVAILAAQNAAGSGLVGVASAAPIASGSFIDDFLGPAGAAPNPANWTIDVGSSAEQGWERGSLQSYTDSPDNIRLDGFGNLVIEARKTGDGYTSGRISTRGKLDFPFGTISARIKMPAGQGLWPAFWMLGANIDAVEVGMRMGVEAGDSLTFASGSYEGNRAAYRVTSAKMKYARMDKKVRFTPADRGEAMGTPQ